jgi:hypothetical protein
MAAQEKLRQKLARAERSLTPEVRRQVQQALRQVAELERAGVEQVGYRLASPFDHRNLRSSSEHGGG